MFRFEHKPSKHYIYIYIHLRLMHSLFVLRQAGGNPYFSMPPNLRLSFLIFYVIMSYADVG